MLRSDIFSRVLAREPLRFEGKGITIGLPLDVLSMPADINTPHKRVHIEAYGGALAFGVACQQQSCGVVLVGQFLGHPVPLLLLGLAIFEQGPVLRSGGVC